MKNNNGYSQYRQTLGKLLDAKILAKLPLLVLKGNSDFIASLSIKTLRQQWQSQGWSIERVEGQNLSLERFLDAATASSMFEPARISFVHEAAQIPDLLEALKNLAQTSSIKNPMCLIFKGEPPAKLAKEFARLSANFLNCDQPAPWDLKDFISDRLKFYQLNFAADAVPLFAQSVGEDLFKIENELNRLSLSFIDHKGSISSSELRPLLSFLREDHAFKIDNFLTQEAFHQALILFKDLMDRGESGIAVLGILALHCRRALQIHARRNLSPKLIAEQLRLSLTAVQNYLPYVAKRSPVIFNKALQLCFEADRKMKSTRQDEELLLDRIVWELRGELVMNRPSPSRQQGIRI